MDWGGAPAPRAHAALPAPHLVDHLPYPRPAGTDTGPFRVDVGIIRRHGDLGAMTGLPSDRFDLDRPVEEFGYLELHQPPHEIGVAPADDDLRSLGIAADLEDEGL